MKVVVKIADPMGHKAQSLTVKEAAQKFPFSSKGLGHPLVALEGQVVQDAKEFGARLSDLVDQQRTEVQVDVIPQVAGG
jgi:hypothetical protein